jgi:hypothetical protein
MGCFKTAGMPRLRQRPLQQIWRDHLLAGSILNSDKGVFDEGLFVFVYPKDNAACHTAVVGYTECLLSSETFIVWTLEEVVSALQQHTQAKWVDDFRDRYLNFDKLAQA